jgi:putative Mg2+ transporter-C (MgtC) family protein
MDIPWQYVERIGAAFIFGALLGIEREYRSKPAGLRTIILITVGSCVFSLLNLTIKTESPDRIASTIVTGIGFLGAGVIFREGINVKGLTTAATIWVAAAIGMAIGFGQFSVAVSTLVFVLITLVILSRMEKWLSEKEVKEYRFTLTRNCTIAELESYLKQQKIRFHRFDFTKNADTFSVEYKFHIHAKQYNDLVDYVTTNQDIIHFERR